MVIFFRILTCLKSAHRFTFHLYCANLDLLINIHDSMAYLNTIFGGTMACKCTDYSGELLKLLEEVLHKNDEIKRWNAFQRFKRQYFLNNRSFIADGFTSAWRLQNHGSNMSCMYLNRVEVFTRAGMDFTTLLVDLTASNILKGCVLNKCCLLENMNRTSRLDCEAIRVLAAFNVKSKFMKMLVNFDYILRVPTGSSVVRNAAECLMFNFM